MTKLCQKRGDSDAGMPGISTGDVWITIVKIQVNVSMRENHLRANAVKSEYVHCKRNKVLNVCLISFVLFYASNL